MNLQHLVSVTVKHSLAIGQALRPGAPCDHVDAMDDYTYDGSLNQRSTVFLSWYRLPCRHALNSAKDAPLCLPGSICIADALVDV